MIHIYFTERNLFINSKQQKKNDGSPYSFSRKINYDLSLARCSCNKKAAFFMRAR